WKERAIGARRPPCPGGERRLFAEAQRGGAATDVVGAGLALPEGTPRGAPTKGAESLPIKPRIYVIAMPACKLSLRAFVGKAKRRGVKGQLRATCCRKMKFRRHECRSESKRYIMRS